MNRRLSLFNVTSLAFGFAFLYLPIVLVIVYSFNDFAPGHGLGRLLDPMVGALFRNEAAARRRLAVAAHRRSLSRHARDAARHLAAARAHPRTAASPAAPCSPAWCIAPMVMPEVIIGLSLLLFFVADRTSIAASHHHARAHAPSRCASSPSSCRRGLLTSTARSRRRRWISARRPCAPSSPSRCR